MSFDLETAIAQTTIAYHERQAAQQAARQAEIDAECRKNEAALHAELAPLLPAGLLALMQIIDPEGEARSEWEYPAGVRWYLYRDGDNRYGDGQRYLLAAYRGEPKRDSMLRHIRHIAASELAEEILVNLGEVRDELTAEAAAIAGKSRAELEAEADDEAQRHLAKRRADIFNAVSELEANDPTEPDNVAQVYGELARELHTLLTEPWSAQPALRRLAAKAIHGLFWLEFDADNVPF